MHAGIGIAFCSENELLNSVADEITWREFSPVLKFAK